MIPPGLRAPLSKSSQELSRGTSARHRPDFKSRRARELGRFLEVLRCFFILAEKPQDCSAIPNQVRVDATATQSLPDSVEVVRQEKSQRPAVTLLTVDPIETTVPLRALFLLSSRACGSAEARDSIHVGSKVGAAVCCVVKPAMPSSVAVLQDPVRRVVLHPLDDLPGECFRTEVVGVESRV